MDYGDTKTASPTIDVPSRPTWIVPDANANGDYRSVISPLGSSSC